MGDHKRNPIALLNAQGHPILGPEAEEDLKAQTTVMQEQITAHRMLLDTAKASPLVREYIARQLACDLLMHFVQPGRERQWMETFSRTISNDFALTMTVKAQGFKPHPQTADEPPPPDEPKETLQ